MFEGLPWTMLLSYIGMTLTIQASFLATGFPFAIVLLGMEICLWIGLHKEARQS